MPSLSLINIEDLLSPIDNDTPTGLDIRDDPSPTSSYQTIKNERNLARAAERQSIHDSDNHKADAHWQAICQQAPEIIREQAKDLEVSSWYAEAMLRRHGFSGLRDAFSLIEGMLDHFWDHLHPMPDEYGMETRVSCLAGLNGESAEGVLIAPIRTVALTDGDISYSLWQYHQAIDAQKAADEQIRNEKSAKLGFSIDDIEKSVEQSSLDFLVNLRDDLNECINIFKSIGSKLDELCGLEESPPIRRIVEALEECLGAVNHIAHLRFPVESVEDVSHEETDQGNQVAQTQAPNGPISSREEAFKQLTLISDFFRKTEPHSPVSYILQKSVKWGNMSLEELIEELIPDRSSREHYGELTGVDINE